MDIETFINKLRDTVTKNKTIRSEVNINRQMEFLLHLFTKAKEWELIESCPFDKR